MGDAAVELARAVGYVGAGTVEFIRRSAIRRAFYFLEVNTRLQVEHPVTEPITGLDLVREQLRIARGEPLGYAVAPAPRGWAIEVRLCAEDPDRDYLPTTGTLHAVDVPATVRADIGVAAGIGGRHPLRLDARQDHRARADPRRGRAASCATRSRARGCPASSTNREQLARILAHPAFLAGELDTHFLETHAGELAARAPGLDRLRVAAIAATLTASPSDAIRTRSRRRVGATFASADQHVAYEVGDAPVELGYRPRSMPASTFAIGGKTDARLAVRARRRSPVVRRARRASSRRARDARRRADSCSSMACCSRSSSSRGFPITRTHAVDGGLVAPMPGKVVKVLVAVGQEVAAGAALVVLEAMKMEHTVRAAEAGMVREFHVVAGDQVDSGAFLGTVSTKTDLVAVSRETC